MMGKIEPTRMSLLMKVAAKTTEQMTTGVWHLSYEEMEIVLCLIRCCMEVCKKKEKEECSLKQEN